MDYKKKRCENERLVMQDSKKQKWTYISNKEMGERFPNGGYLIVGDIKKGKDKDVIGYVVEDDKKIQLFPYNPNLKSNEKCMGFISVESEEKQEAFARIVKRTKRKTLLWLLLFALLIAGIGGWYWFNGKDRPNLDETAISYHVEGLVNEDPNNISIPLFTELQIDADTMKGENHLANPEGNPCYFEYHIILKESEEEIYRSELIKPGYAIPEFTANRKLEAGTYPALIRIKTYNLEDHTAQMNGGEVDVQIVVKEKK